VLETTKEQLQRNITEKVNYPDGVDEEFVKSVKLISIGQLFHRWKSDMNWEYVKKQLVPKHMGKITQAQWEEFVKQKTKPKALAISDKFVEISKNIPITWGQADMSEWKKKLSVPTNLIR
jgi:hypothetical protein